MRRALNRGAQASGVPGSMQQKSLRASAGILEVREIESSLCRFAHTREFRVSDHADDSVASDIKPSVHKIKIFPHWIFMTEKVTGHRLIDHRCPRRGFTVGGR